MKKYLISLLVIFFLFMSQIVSASFSDVSSDFHLYKSINWLQEQGVVEGYSDGTFKPDQPVNRAEFLKMLYETIGMEGHNPTLLFPDVPSGEWYTKYVKEAYQTGVVVGYPDGYFRPENEINVAEALKIIDEAFFDVDQLYGDGSSFTYCPTGFLDFDQLLSSENLAKIDQTAWYWKYVHVAGELCIFDFGLQAYGMGGFWMDVHVSRADMAELLYRAKTVKDNDLKKYSSSLTPNDIVSSALSTEQQSAQTKCLELYGSPYLAFSELYGEDRMFCSFGGGECTQGELNDGVCFMETNETYKAASDKCVELGGTPSLDFSELYGEDRIFCSFGSAGECTQGELLDGVCFMEN